MKSSKSFNEQSISHSPTSTFNAMTVHSAYDVIANNRSWGATVCTFPLRGAATTIRSGHKVKYTLKHNTKCFCFYVNIITLVKYGMQQDFSQKLFKYYKQI